MSRAKYRPRLSDQQVLEIRALHARNMSAAAIAQRMGLYPQAVSKVINWQTYTHVTEPEHLQKGCTCPKCTRLRRGDVNVTRVNQTLVTYDCANCGAPSVGAMAGGAIRACNGLVHCQECGGKP